MTLAFSKDTFALHAAAVEKEILLHCYRFMGSVQDSEDMYQETLIRAWARRDSLNSEENFRPWLYKIASNICLDHLKKQKRRAMPNIQYLAADPVTPFPAPIDEPIWLDPFPDQLLPKDNRLLEDSIKVQEDVSLAFMTAIHLLTPQQRAALIFIDVLDWSAKESAEALETSVSAINGLIYRARKKLKEGRRATVRDKVQKSSISTLLKQFVEAWENSDVDQLTALLTEDAIFNMPPFPCWYEGRVAIHTMVSRTLFSSQANGVWRLVRTGANLQPAFILSQLNPDQRSHDDFGLIVLNLAGREISEIVAFLNPELIHYFN